MPRLEVNVLDDVTISAGYNLGFGGAAVAGIQAGDRQLDVRVASQGQAGFWWVLSAAEGWETFVPWILRRCSIIVSAIFPTEAADSWDVRIGTCRAGLYGIAGGSGLDPDLERALISYNYVVACEKESRLQSLSQHRMAKHSQAGS